MRLTIKAPSLISCIIDVQCLFLNCFKLFTISYCKLKIICILKSESIVLAESAKNKSNILIQNLFNHCFEKTTNLNRILILIELDLRLRLRFIYFFCLRPRHEKSSKTKYINALQKHLVAMTRCQRKTKRSPKSASTSK